MTPEEILFYIGQGLGIVAVILGFVSFQMKTPGRILLFQIVTASVFALHYLLIGAPTAVWLNLLAAVQCTVYYLLGRRGGAGRIVPRLFAAAVVVASILTWTGWYTLLIMVGLAINALSLSFSRAQSIRMAQFVKTPTCFLYNLLVLSLGGAVYEAAVFLSSLIGVLRARPKSKGATGGQF